MANNDHEAVLSALLTYLQTTLGTNFQTYTRKEKFLVNVDAQPVLFVRQIGGDYEFGSTIQQTVTMDVEIWIGCAASQDDATPSDTELNVLKKLVLDAFAPDDRWSGRFTLSGAVFWCRIEGHSDQYPGDIGPNSLCALPVKITLP